MTKAEAQAVNTAFNVSDPVFDFLLDINLGIDACHEGGCLEKAAAGSAYCDSRMQTHLFYYKGIIIDGITDQCVAPACKYGRFWIVRGQNRESSSFCFERKRP